LEKFAYWWKNRAGEIHWASQRRLPASPWGHREETMRGKEQEMGKNTWLLLTAIALVLGLMAGCAGGTASTETVSASEVRSFKDYPDHAFNAKQYVKGMVKGGHNLLMWQDPAADLSVYTTAELADFGDRLLPVQSEFAYAPFVKHFNLSLRNSLKVSQGAGGLRIEGEIVECNPGSRAARVWVGMGAGKAASAVVCEVYEPGRMTPSLRIYSRDTASSGMWGGDSVAMLNNIFDQLAVRMASVLEAKIGT
jgi:hypothetical protein